VRTDVADMTHRQESGQNVGGQDRNRDLHHQIEVQPGLDDRVRGIESAGERRGQAPAEDDSEEGRDDGLQ